MKVLSTWILCKPPKQNPKFVWIKRQSILTFLQPLILILVLISYFYSLVYVKTLPNETKMLGETNRKYLILIELVQIMVTIE